MARLNYEHASFRAVVAADLAGTFGDTTSPNLILVDINASGQLVAAAQGAAIGVIDATEGKKDPTVANFNTALAGRSYTVLVQTEMTDADDLTAGQTLWSTAGGDVVTTVPGAGTVQVVGKVVEKENGVVSAWLNF